MRIRGRVFAALAIAAIVVARLGAPDAEAAITFGSKSQATTSFDDPFQWSHTVNSGEDFLSVCIALRDNGTTVNSVTFNGDALIRAVQRKHSSEDATSEIWYRTAPDVTTGTISVDLSTFDAIRGIATNWSGVDQSGSPIDTTGSNQGDSATPSTTVTTTANGSVIVDCLFHEDSAVSTPGGSQTTIFANDDGVWNTGASYIIKATAGSQAMSWTSGNDVWTHAVAAFKAAGGASAPVPPLPSPKIISIY